MLNWKKKANKLGEGPWGEYRDTAEEIGLTKFVD